MINRIRNALLAARLRRVLVQALDHVPLYAREWKAAGIDPLQLELPRELHRLPVLRKAVLAGTPIEDRCDARFLRAKLREEPTSGSTGQPCVVRIDPRSLRRRRIRFLRALMACGYRPGQRLMLITDPPYPRGAAWVRWTYVDLRLGEQAIWDAYERTRPHVLYGPLSSLLLLARRISGARRHGPRLVVSTAEQLTVGHRRTLEEAFGAPVADFYGMAELGLIAFAPPGERCYRVFPGEHFIEQLPVVGADGLRRLVVTDLGGGAMPLVRFDTGDLVRVDETRCDAPIVQISGREVDCLRLANGGWLSPFEVTLALDRVAGIRQYQVVQRDDFGIDLFVSPGTRDASAVLERAREALLAVCGSSTPIAVHERSEQPLQPDRKQRVVSSYVGAV